jgi:hypothetical protein
MVGRLERWSDAPLAPPLTPKANTVRSRQRRRGPCSEATNREPPAAGIIVSTALPRRHRAFPSAKQ